MVGAAPASEEALLGGVGEIDGTEPYPGRTAAGVEAAERSPASAASRFSSNAVAFRLVLGMALVLLLEGLVLLVLSTSSSSSLLLMMLT